MLENMLDCNLSSHCLVVMQSWWFYQRSQMVTKLIFNY